MANALISINFANTADLQAGTSQTTSVNPVGLKAALQSGGSLYGVNLNDAVLEGTLKVVGQTTLGGSVSGLKLAIGSNSVAGDAGTITATNNISAGGSLIFGGVGSNIVGTNAIGVRTISTTVPSVCGSSGDIWYTV